MSRSAAQARAVLAKLNRRQQARFTALTNRAAQALARQILIGVPRVTGHLASTLQIKGGGVSIGGNGSDAVAVEFGTAHRPPNPFMRPAITRFIPDARAAARLSLK